MSNSSSMRPHSARPSLFALHIILGMAVCFLIGFIASVAWASGTDAGATPALRSSLFDYFPARPALRSDTGNGITPRGTAIAIVIDDLGSSEARTRRAMALPSAVTLSFLPYPEATPALAAEAARDGHEILVHVPMQPLSARHNPGPMALKVGQSPEEITRRLLWALSRVPDHTGVNNHEGSRFTLDRVALEPVMQALAEKNLFFLDSRTIGHSKASLVARAYDVPTAGRDVFLDDTISAHAVAHQLDNLERQARKHGIAIAIGHPHDVTMAALERWTAAEKGFTLVPVSTAIRMEEARPTASAALLPSGS